MTEAALSAAETETLEAVAARLVPSDESGPGAVEAGVVRYLLNALAGEYRALRADYRSGLAEVESLAAERGGRPFLQLEPAEQDAVLAALEGGPSSRAFFELVRGHVIEGMFADPRWGGNADGAGWKLIGYPGPRRVWTAAEQGFDGGGAVGEASAAYAARVEDTPASPAEPPRPASPSAARPASAGLAGAGLAADVVLVGLGAACGIAARVLAAAGLDVVALEAGPWIDPDETTLDELRNDVREWLAQPKAAHEVPSWRTTPSETSGPSPWPMLMVNAVGGSTVHYPGLSIRFDPWNFRSRSRVLERYGPEAIPAGSTLVDWPLDYEELEPYYGLVEREIGVAGCAGNPFEAARSSEYPLPPLRRSGWTELMDGAARRLGWHPFPAPAALNSEPYNGNEACTYCGFCSANGCYRAAKGSTDVTAIRRALADGLRIETGARAIRIEVDDRGRATGVTYVRDGEERFQPARAVLLGTFTYENTRLLLLSRSAAHPRGLANGSGQVGRHYMAHASLAVFGRFPGRKLNLWSGSWAQATCLDDWNADNFDHGELGFVGGALLSAPHELKPIACARQPLPPGTPRWGSAWKRWLAENAGSVAYVNAQMECLPYEDNVLDLDPAVTDPYGLPVVRVTHRLGENERRGCDFMAAKLAAWLREAGAGETWRPPGYPVEARHCYGGTRMGDDPATSVVDRFGFAHEVPNLGVLGASAFPTTAGYNPTLTVQALAWRTAERLVDDWDSVAGGRNQIGNTIRNRF